MDFSSLDLREAADKEYWVHLRLGDVLLYADDAKEKPCRVKVGSIADPEIEQAAKAVTRSGNASATVEAQLANAANRDKRREIESRLDDIERQAEKAVVRFLMCSIKGWENIEKGGKPLEFSSEALKDMSQPKAPLFRLALTLAEDMGKVQSPFSQAESD